MIIVTIANERRQYMNKDKKNPYATMEGGKIDAPNGTNHPSSTVKRGDDLRHAGGK